MLRVLWTSPPITSRISPDMGRSSVSASATSVHRPRTSPDERFVSSSIAKVLKCAYVEGIMAKKIKTSRTDVTHAPSPFAAAYAARLAKQVNEELSSFRSASMRKKRVRAARK